MTRKQTALTTLLFAAIGLTLFFAFDFSGDYAINDDWGYTTPIGWWVVEKRLALTHWQSMPLLTQLVFGVAWAEVFGFSQGGLRHLTLVFALITSAAVFACARILRLPVALSGLCAVLPFASPIFVGLSYSFMADVPAMAFVTLSLLFFMRSFDHSDQRGWNYALGVVFLLLAILLRQTAVAVAMALVLAEPVARGFSVMRMARTLGVLAMAFLTYFAFDALLETYFGLPRVYAAKSEALVVFMSDILAANFGALRHSLEAVLIACAQFGLFAVPVLPIFCSVLWQRGPGLMLGAIGSAVLLTVASLVLGVGVLSAPDSQLITMEGLGPRTIAGEVRVAGALIVGGITWLGHFGLVCACLAAMTGMVQEDDWASRRTKGSVVLLALTALLTFAPHTVAYAAVFDRYALLPSILLVLVVLRVVGDAASRITVWSAAGLIVVGFAASLSLTADFFRWQDARYALIDRLVATGVPPDQIDGGFEYNNLAEVLARPEAAISMPLVDPSDRPVRLTRTPGSGEVIATEEIPQFLGMRLERIYAVR